MNKIEKEKNTNNSHSSICISPLELRIQDCIDNKVIFKLKHNIPITQNDIVELEELLCNGLYSPEDYFYSSGSNSLGEIVREIVGLDTTVAKREFSKFLNNPKLNSKQIYFINKIVDYYIQNGIMKDYSVLLDSPFTDKGPLMEIFTDTFKWREVREVIDSINSNATV